MDNGFNHMKIKRFLRCIEVPGTKCRDHVYRTPTYDAARNFGELGGFLWLQLILGGGAEALAYIQIRTSFRPQSLTTTNPCWPLRVRDSFFSAAKGRE